MTFEEAEARFRELQARVQRGEAISRAEYEDQVSQLAVQDDRGVLWEINPRTGKWMYFDGAEWVGGTPPGRDHSTVMPAPRAPVPPTSGAQSSTPFMPPNAGVVPPPPPPVSSSSQSGGPVPLPSRPVPGGMRPTPQMPDPIPSYARVDRSGSAPPPPGVGPQQVPPRVLRQGPLGGPNREWVPLAIGAVVLLFCAVLLFFGGRFVLASLGPATTPTRGLAAVPLATNTVVPTPIRLPTSAVATPTGAPVIAKVIESTVNVREAPNTKAKILTKVRKDAQISLLARNESGDWYQVKVTGVSGPAWIFADTLQIVSGDAKFLPVAGTGPAQAPTKAGLQGAATPTVIGARP